MEVLPVSGASLFKGNAELYCSKCLHHVFFDLKKNPTRNPFYIITAIEHGGLSPYTYFPVNVTTWK